MDEYDSCKHSVLVHTVYWMYPRLLGVVYPFTSTNSLGHELDTPYGSATQF